MMERAAPIGLFAALALVVMAQGAQAETLGAVSPADAAAPRARIDLTAAHPAVVSYAEASALQSAGLARTSVEQQVTSGGGAASFGFLCGLQPAYYHAGAADARGYDPQGKFVGAKLSFAFK